MEKVKESNAIQYECNINNPEEGMTISIGRTRGSSSKFNEEARYHLDAVGIRELHKTLGELINSMK